MTYSEFENTILDSTPSDWVFTGSGIVFRSDISIFIEYCLVDEEVMRETGHLKNRIHGYQQGSKFRLFYNGSCLYTQWFVVAGSGLAVCAIPIQEGEQGHGDIEVERK